MAVKVLIRLLAALFLLGGGVLSYWLVKNRSLAPLDIAGPAIFITGTGLFLLKKWAAVIARGMCAILAGLFLCMTAAIVLKRPGHLDFDIISAVIIVFGFTLPCIFLSLPSVLKHFK